MNRDFTSALHWLQFSDSALPVGAFSFSNGVETAVHEGLVRTPEELEQLVRSALRAMASLEGVAALESFRCVQVMSCKQTMSCKRSEEASYPEEAQSTEMASFTKMASSTKESPSTEETLQQLRRIDRRLLAFKLNEESRQMSLRMGKKWVELGASLLPHPLLQRWKEEISAQRSPGNQAVAQGVLFALAGNRAEELFATLCFGVMNQMTGAALRCMKISHFETQRMLFRLSEEVAPLYEEVQPLSLHEMHSFAPQLDLLASLHEQGPLRMFMS
jgi:urease accessory protein